MRATIAVLPGDGIGPEVIAVTLDLLEVIAGRREHQWTFNEGLFGGCAIDAVGESLPEETIGICEAADAVLMGSVGGPKWSEPTAKVRPEQGLLRLRSHFGVFANLRPVRAYPALAGRTPLRPDLLDGVDILIVRELTGGAYFGPRREQDGGASAYDTMLYSVPEVQRVAKVAFRAAQGRRKRLTSVDKANVLASSRLWRRTVSDMAPDYADVTLEHALVDSCAMQLILTPQRYDVILAENLFGDILSDEAAVLAGSLGMLPSASLGASTFGIYEPVHGSAPDIAGRGIANPIGAILSAAMLLRYSLGLEAEATALEDAVDLTLANGARTADIAGRDGTAIGTREFAQAVRDHLKGDLAHQAGQHR